jgi:hypothetical protein
VSTSADGVSLIARHVAAAAAPDIAYYKVRQRNQGPG